MPRESMTWTCAPGERNNGGCMRMQISIGQYAIILAARQARQKLADPDLHRNGGIRKNLDLLRIGQEVLARLRHAGIQLPEIDLSYPPMAAAAPADVESGQAPAVDEVHQNGRRQP